MNRKELLLGLLIMVAMAMPIAVLAEGLAFDDDHDLLVLPGCKLALRYNNKTFVPVKVAPFCKQEEGYFLGQEPTQSFQIEEQYSAQMKGNTRGERIVVECYDTGKLGRISTGRLKKEFTKNNKVKEINLTYDRIIKETGATKSGLENLRSLVVFEVSPGDGSSKYRLFAFQHENILTMYARRMRPNSNGFDDQAPVIVSQLSFQLEPDLKGNVQVEYTE
ncbi:MAG: hypothetical protein H6677_14015 [Candidatus Obscuribacterales bacterium]|nr:hypothetical protein [Candidatus Obscuribacterales bacterium]